MTISSLEALLRSMSMILEEQYNAERAKPPKHTSGTINTRHRPTTATEPTHGIVKKRNEEIKIDKIIALNLNEEFIFLHDSKSHNIEELKK